VRRWLGEEAVELIIGTFHLSSHPALARLEIAWMLRRAA
jgi:hypothetical protein